MKIWVVVADEREALFYNVGGAERRGISSEGRWPDGRRVNDRFHLVLRLTNPQARPDRELESDRPGRAFSSSTGQRHAIDGERSARRRDQEDFARRVADEIERSRHARTFDRVVLAAGPRMLGLIRAALSEPARACLAAEIAKDLVRFEGHDLLEHLPQRAVQRPSARA
jgi:protein required for attachment to host cells